MNSRIVCIELEGEDRAKVEEAAEALAMHLGEMTATWETQLPDGVTKSNVLVTDPDDTTGAHDWETGASGDQGDGDEEEEEEEGGTGI